MHKKEEKKNISKKKQKNVSKKEQRKTDKIQTQTYKYQYRIVKMLIILIKWKQKALSKYHSFIKPF